jgi:hypothetical protein
MNTIQCTGCGNKLPQQLAACPRCGQPNKTTSNRLLILAIAVLSIVAIAAGLWFYLGHARTHLAQSSLNPQPNLPTQTAVKRTPVVLDATAEHAAALEAIDSYNASKAQGNLPLMCSYGTVIVVKFMNAHDDANVQTWRAQEKTDCAAANAYTVARLNSP